MRGIHREMNRESTPPKLLAREKKKRGTVFCELLLGFLFLFFCLCVCVCVVLVRFGLFVCFFCNQQGLKTGVFKVSGPGWERALRCCPTKGEKANKHPEADGLIPGTPGVQSGLGRCVFFLEHSSECCIHREPSTVIKEPLGHISLFHPSV